MIINAFENTDQWNHSHCEGCWQTNVKNATGATNSMLGRYRLLVLGGLGGGDKGYLQGGQNSHNFYTKIIL